MTTTSRVRGILLLQAVCAVALGAAAAGVRAQQPGAAVASPAPVPLDRVVGVVNGDLILESDVDAEERFGAFQPFRATVDTRQAVIDRLVDRDLIEQQMVEQPPAPVTDADLDKQLARLRKTIPECAAYHCETDAGWAKFCSDHGFTVDEVRERWRRRMEVLRFVEQRFRMGVEISQAEVDTYYKTKLVPVYQKRGATPPAEAAIADRIREILVQEQVTGLLDDWLKALRAQGSVRMLTTEGGGGR